MHPELFLIVYRMQEREREERLRHLLAAQERVSALPVGRPVRVARRLGWVQRWQESVRPDATADACCTMA